MNRDLKVSASPSTCRRRSILLLIASCVAFLALAGSAQAAGGSVVGWGYNDYGQAGSGSASGSGCKCIGSPTPVSGVSGATQLSAGYYHSLALLGNGSVMAWGYNKTGALGIGTETDTVVPTPVSGLSNVIEVSAGIETSLALLANGTVMAWGDNSYGELGIGSSTGPEDCNGTPCSLKPVQVPGLSNVIAISDGYYANLALLANGTVMAWGYDYYAQTGDGTGTQSGCECVDHPVPVPGISGAVGISAGWYDGGVLMADGTARTWGYDYEGQLGNGEPVRSSSSGCYCLGPTPVVGLAGVRQLSMGGYHGMAVLQDGTVRSWGENYDNQLGLNTTTRTGCSCIASPNAVPGLSGVQSLSAGGYETLALLSSGGVTGWGEDNYGQLGQGSTAEWRNLNAVPSLSGASEIAGANYTSLALVGPSQTLNVAFAGAGAGTVGANGILCTSACSGRLPQGQVKTLRAEAAAGSGFAGFSGPCSGTGTCQLRLEGDQTVTATFGPAAGTKIAKATINRKKRTATFTFSAPGAITGYECKLVRPQPKRHHKAKASKVQKAKFAACPATKTYKNLIPGSYTFSVRALDVLGPDAHPALRKFKLHAPPKHHKRHAY